MGVALSQGARGFTVELEWVRWFRKEVAPSQGAKGFEVGLEWGRSLR